MSSSISSISSVALRPLEAPSSPSSPSSSSLHPPPRLRRPRRVLYPANQSRVLRPREEPDRVRRWLLLLSALVFLQICSEETLTCSELQTQSPDAAACPPQEGEGCLDTAQGWTGEEPWRIQTAASEPHMECVVA